MDGSGTGTGRHEDRHDPQGQSRSVEPTNSVTNIQVPKSLSDVIVELFKAAAKLWHDKDFRRLVKNPWTYTTLTLICFVGLLAWHFGLLGSGLLNWKPGQSGTGVGGTGVGGTGVGDGPIVLEGLVIDRKYAELARKAIAAKRPYFVEAVTMQYDIEDTPSKRNVSWRNTYTIRALKELAPENQVFEEGFDTEAQEKKHWVGTEEEQPVPGKVLWKAFWVSLHLKKGETRTFTTGVDLTINLPLGKQRLDYSGRELEPNEDYIGYPNPDDYIGNILLVARSKTTLIRPNSDRAAVLSPIPKHQTEIDQPQTSGTRFTAQSEGNGWSTVSKEWTNIVPGEEVAVFFKWPITVLEGTVKKGSIVSSNSRRTSSTTQ
jgi:hypothetical protein